MGEDATLDAFLGDDEEPDGTTGVDDGADREDTTDHVAHGTEKPERALAEPATTTFAFVPSGATCEHCGTTVERRWHQDGSLVCADCKDW